jgi:FkbM family methyltransferase
MRLRGFAKKLLFGSAPCLRGRFPYYGYTVYFPPGSITFERACADGIYERNTTNLILALAEPGTTYFDVGANIGLLSVPVLAARTGVKVVSIEASPNTLPFLTKTHAVARRREDWTVIGAAVGAKSGEAEFWSGDVVLGAHDGLRDTGRGGAKRAVRVPVKTLDEIWQAQGYPTVSVIKMDIEGGECSALRGAKEIIARERPVFIIEWIDQNLKPYGIDPVELLTLCTAMSYKAYASPNLVPIDAKPMLKMAMAQTDTFILVPRARVSSRRAAQITMNEPSKQCPQMILTNSCNSIFL